MYFKGFLFVFSKFLSAFLNQYLSILNFSFPFTKEGSDCSSCLGTELHFKSPGIGVSGWYPGRSAIWGFSGGFYVDVGDDDVTYNN